MVTALSLQAPVSSESVLVTVSNSSNPVILLEVAPCTSKGIA